MRRERPQVKASSAPAISAGGRRDASDDLPLDIAFLPAFCDVPAKALRAAADEASCGSLSASAALVASGAVSECLYYRCLADHLGLAYRSDWPRLADSIDPRAAFRRRIVALHGTPGGWLAAPSGRDLRMLLEVRRRGLDALPAIAITTPTHFADVVCRRAGPVVARSAAEALPTVAPHLSAKRSVEASALVAGIVMALLSVTGVGLGSRPVLDTFGVLFLSSIALKSLVCFWGLAAREAPPPEIADEALPVYTVLVPLYDEPRMMAPLVDSLSRLDYPRARLEILVLLEENDYATLEAAQAIALPPHVRIVLTPDGLPRTKPRALNVGLMQARGSLVTIFDAEDRPDADQLRLAAAHFSRLPESVACLQARLSIRNGAAALLPLLFSIEYAALFDLFNVGVARLGLPMALGGTSNHFRKAALEAVGAWDSWNVTEDADLGIRLARFGYETGSLDSTTTEDAPVELGSWFKQRRRWTKGWMQTLVVLARDRTAARDLGFLRTIYTALVLTSLVTGPLATPIFCGVVVWHLATVGLPQPVSAIEHAEAALAAAVLLLGLVTVLWTHGAGLKRHRLIRYLPALPLMLPYTLMISFAAWGGLWDLLRNPFHWHKTDHGIAAGPLLRGTRRVGSARRRTAPPRRR